MHEVVIIIAKYLLILSALGCLIVYLDLNKRDKKEFILTAISGAIIAILLAKIGSYLFYDTRPFIAGHFSPYFSHGNDNGFPSDHTLLTSFLAFLVLKYNHKAGVFLLLAATAIGIARVIAGVHHLVDIIGAFAFAGLGFYLGIKLVRHFKPVKKPAG